VAAGDEILGLSRGLLYAGAKSLLLTLWDVHDRSTAEVMRSFYDHFRHAPENRASALQTAVLDARRSYPHPFHWAPFVLVGKAP
jgi:CHAT domain-containing protein